MKTLKYILLIVLTAIGISCENDLNIEPAQSISTETALSSEDNIINILIGAYDEAGQGPTFGGQTQIIADLLGNSGQVGWGGSFIDPRQLNNKSILTNNVFVRDLWYNSYEIINQSNLVIDNISLVTSGKANQVEGEAKFLRALSYFDLVRLFGKQYTAGGANSQLGVPLQLKGIIEYAEDLSIARNTVEEVYTQIINDLNEAYNKLPASNSYFVDKYAAKALLSRVYLQQGAYANARDAAHDVLQSSGHSLTPTFAGAFNNNVDSSEDIFAFQVTSQTGAQQLINFYASQANGGRQGDITIQPGYLALFDDVANDIRDNFNYVSPDNGEDLTSKYTNQFANISMFRIAEMHLIRAEANFREGSSLGLAPLVEINTLRARSSASPLGAVTLALILNERELELAFEGFFLHDYKRTQRTVAGISFDSDSLVLPIPDLEMDTNSKMVQNPGYTN
ncbi:SusD-like starch-binding protein associating with outer membrane [Lutibacter sp. Hel_I_33_5]|uniref:RagB/SusD family nutrient uptake outer membrane protein n=1 Tax=Lutibacter sp. Hel_I_33_5 TaxID=1566289 RepID=UPI0011A71017|nr:RagB/SusD family nutrient uptake outer membrane protein [Lutibacter sp. Hel_I_33_5]TVZ57150.1 SusD-like starch-binding protein associating with outer membrane [Lutibacter sp. Hel_I_33_5]